MKNELKLILIINLFKMMVLAKRYNLDFDITLMNKFEEMDGSYLDSKDTEIGSDNIIEDMKELIYELYKISVIEPEVITTRLDIIFESRPGMRIGCVRSLKDKYEKPQLDINALKKVNLSHYYDYRLNKKISSLTRKLPNIKDANEKLKVLREINNITDTSKLEKAGDDRAITDTLNIGDTDQMVEAIKEAKEERSDKGILTLGWEHINRMYQLGLRPGEFTLHTALSHNYKSGFTLSKFLQAVTLNEPNMFERDKGKKPLALLVSLEDEMSHIIEFVYTYLYASANDGKLPDYMNTPDKEIADYITKMLSAKGWVVKFIKADPNDWSADGLFTLVEDFEREGFALKLIDIDYPTLLPFQDCKEAKHDCLRLMMRRIRNFFNRRKTTVIAPAQASPAATTLLRNGTPHEEMAKEMANKGYTSGSSQIAQDVDLGTYIHKCIIDGQAWLTVQRDKHRLPTQIPEKEKFVMLKFPENGPILPDIWLGEDLQIHKKKPESVHDINALNSGPLDLGI